MLLLLNHCAGCSSASVLYFPLITHNFREQECCTIIMFQLHIFLAIHEVYFIKLFRRSGHRGLCALNESQNASSVNIINHFKGSAKFMFRGQNNSPMNHPDFTFCPSVIDVFPPFCMFSGSFHMNET